jgi:hypothetical protein
LSAIDFGGNKSRQNWQPKTMIKTLPTSRVNDRRGDVVRILQNAKTKICECIDSLALVDDNRTTAGSLNIEEKYPVAIGRQASSRMCLELL